MKDRIGIIQAVLVLVGLSLASHTGAFAQSPERTQAEALARRAADRLSSLHGEADRLASEERTVLTDLRRLELEREIRAEELRQAQADETTVSAQLAAVDAQIASLEAREAADAPLLRSRLLSLYKLGRGRYLRLLLSTSDVRRIGQASRLVATIAEQDRSQVAAHERRLGELTASRRALQDHQSRLVPLRAAANRARLAAEQAVEVRNARVREIDQRRDLNASLVEELLAAQRKLQTTLGGLSSAVTPSLPIGPFRGDLDWPVAGTLRRGFGPGAGRRISSGIDVAATEDQQVQAVHDGVVAYADAFTGFGRLVIVDHGSQTFSLYGNLKELGVAKGARVQRGEALGGVGTSPTGAAGLYFELRIDGRPVDPLQWLKKKP